MNLSVLTSLLNSATNVGTFFEKTKKNEEFLFLVLVKLLDIDGLLHLKSLQL